MIELDCPECGKTGVRVEVQTVRALVSISLRRLTASEYWFCRTPACSVVYYSAGGHRVTVDQVRERVFQKEPDADDVQVCYCFRHTVGEVCTASAELHARLLHDIQDGIAAGQCACDVRNPQGTCCLGNVRAVMRQTGDCGTGDDAPCPATPVGGLESVCHA